jgi:MFS family permease
MTERVAESAGSPGRVRAVRIIAWVMAVAAVAFGLFTAVFGIISETQRIHSFHNVVVASLLLIVSAPAAIAIARDPERSGRALMVLSAVAVAGAVTMILALTFDPFTAPFVILSGVLWVLRPDRTRPFPSGRVSPLLIVLVLAAVVPLGAYALGQAELSRIDRSSEHAEFFHWVETSFFAAAILLLGLLASIRPAAYRLAAWCGGLALAIVGLASVLLPEYASAMDPLWGWAALVGGVVFVAAAEWEGRRLGNRAVDAR